MIDPLTISIASLAISLASASVAAFTAWRTHMHRGKVAMTRPTLIALAFDVGSPGNVSSPKIYLRALLYCTGKRGHVIESMHAVLKLGTSQQIFSFWALGEPTLSRGSGVYVPDTGAVFHHHFLLADKGRAFEFDFLPGKHALEIFGTPVYRKTPIRLLSVDLEITKHQADHLNSDRAHAVYYDWNPETEGYVPHLEVHHRSAGK
jgi:hypothetical protein